ncbi:MAG: DUF1573 domain-containing protein [Flavobacteriales bacterium]|nr:DUF1573 domain-containing protein [Flavobacteriales bacterium]
MAASGLFFGQTTEDTAPVVGAQIEVQSDTYDFGEIQKGADGTCVFTLKNVGFEPLIISKCDKTCGCTVPSCDNDPVLPGGTTEVTVKYDTQRVGPFQKSVKVHSNAENQPLLILKIKGTVLAN